MDATGRLVQKPQDETHFNQIYNYALLLKNTQQMNNSALQICEFISSSHDTQGTMEFLSRFRSELRKQFCETKMAELVVTDYSWMEMHAVLEAFNYGESMEDYAHRVFAYANSGKKDDKKSFLASCASHTMHRFLQIFLFLL